MKNAAVIITTLRVTITKCNTARDTHRERERERERELGKRKRERK